jgi:hypothetical protein
MAKFSYVACIAAGAVLFLDTAPAHACDCAGPPLRSPFIGGDGAPLKWKYGTHVVSHGPPEMLCYFKSVSNESGFDVRDVRWTVANFFRRVISKNQTVESCPEVAGEPKATPTNGPLNFSVSSDRYETTVIEPKGGWGEQASSGQFNTNPQFAQTFPALRNEISLDIEAADGKTSVANVTFESVGKQDNKNVYLTYIAANNSETAVTVLVNLAATGPMLEKVPMIQRRLTLRPKMRAQFDVVTEGQMVMQPALVVLYDSVERVSGIDTAGFYTVSGATKSRTDQSFWQSIR